MDKKEMKEYHYFVRYSYQYYFLTAGVITMLGGTIEYICDHAIQSMEDVDQMVAFVRNVRGPKKDIIIDNYVLLRIDEKE